MERSRIKKINKNGGQAMITSVVFFLFISLTTIAGLVSPTVRDYTTSRLNLDSKKVYYATESGTEDYVYRLTNSKPVVSEESLSIDGIDVETIATTDSNISIETTGDKKSLTRKVQVDFSSDLEAEFNYGLQVGEGGVDLQSSTINGNVFSNGPITGDSSSRITGTAISASGIPVFIDQMNGTGVPFYDRSFGNSYATQNLAQSFILDTSAPLLKASLYIKKSGSPDDLTVRVVDDVNRGPGSTIYATGTISSSSVSTSYSWVDVNFTTHPTLNINQTYWLILDPPAVKGSSSSKYYTAGASDIYSQGDYIDGVSMYWNGTEWVSMYVVGEDLYFKIYLGGSVGSITGTSGSQWNPLYVGTISGTAQANTVNYVNSTGLIYCQSGVGNNKSCTYQEDPQQESLPIPDSYIETWKLEAESGGTHIGNYSVGYAGATLGPKKINGDLNISGGGTLTVSGTLWVTGNINLSGGAHIVLSSSYAESDGVIVADGNITISSGASVSGSGFLESYIMLLTTSSSSSAINISGGSGAVILYAADGTLNVTGGATVKSATAYRIIVAGGSSLVYEDGLTNVAFQIGPTSAASMFSLKDWDEVE